jgi:predicted nucleotidyltransferase
MTDLRTAALRALEAYDNRELLTFFMEDIRIALAQPEDKSQAAFEHWVETVEATQEQPIIQPEIKEDKEARWLPMPWKGLTEEEHNYYKACGFVGVTAVEEKLRAKNSTLACIPAVPPG